MDNRRLQSLIRVATEIEEMERSALSPTAPLRLRHARGHSPQPRRRASRVLWRIAAFSSAAAMVGLAVYLARPGATPTPSMPVAQIPSSGPSDAPAAELASVDAAPSAGGQAVELVKVTPKITVEHARRIIDDLLHPPQIAAGVLAIYEDASGVVRCVRWQPHDFGGRRFDQLRPGELVRVSYGTHCAIVGPHRLIAVAVRGPIEKLPDSDERAQELAECIVGESAARCEAQPTTVGPNSPGCFPTGLQVMVETLAMGKP